MSRKFSDSLDQDLEDTFFSTDEFAELVTITRGANSTSDIAAIAKDRAYKTVEHQAAIESKDFDFQRSRYQILLAEVTPKPGDRISVANGDVFEAMILGGKRCFELLDDGRVLRVHTNKVS